MINYNNIHRYDDMKFGEYLKLPGFSHSFLKRENFGVAKDFEINDNMRLGSMVDAILTEPGKAAMSDPIYPIARDIAMQIVKSFGGLLVQFQKQISFLGDATFQDFILPITGRLDFLLPGQAVIDLKITKSKNIPALIAFMGYENQLWNYAKLSGVNKAYLMIYSVPLKKTEIHLVDCSGSYNDFWAYRIIKFGKVNSSV